MKKPLYNLIFIEVSIMNVCLMCAIYNMYIRNYTRSQI